MNSNYNTHAPSPSSNNYRSDTSIISGRSTNTGNGTVADMVWKKYKKKIKNQIEIPPTNLKKWVREIGEILVMMESLSYDWTLVFRWNDYQRNRHAKQKSKETEEQKKKSGRIAGAGKNKKGNGKGKDKINNHICSKI